MSIFRAISGIFHQTTTGFFTGIIFVMALFAGMYLFQEHEDEWTGLPIVQEITDTYQEGWSSLGELAGDAVDQFYATRLEGMEDIKIVDYESEPTETGVKGGKVAVASSWDRKKILRKLKKEGFSKGKLRAAGKYLDYIDEYKDLALIDMMDTKVLASVKLAQGILESNAGRSHLATNTNNHFGIKARPGKSARQKIRQKRYSDLRNEEFLWKSPAIGAFNFHDDNRYDRFEVYRSVGDSYRRHTQLLTKSCTPGKTGCYSWIWRAYPVGGYHDITEAALLFEHRSHIKPRKFFNGTTRVPYYAACAAGLKMAGYATSRRYHQKLSYIIDTYELWRFDVDLIQAMAQ